MAMNKLLVEFKKLNENAVTPTFGTEFSAGADLYSAEGDIAFVGWLLTVRKN